MATWNKDDVALAAILVGEASGVFAGFCPSWFTVSSPFFHDQAAFKGNVKRIRWGEAAGTAIVTATGWALAQVSGKPMMLYLSVAIAAVFVIGYEYMIKHPATDGG